MLSFTWRTEILSVLWKGVEERVKFNIIYPLDRAEWKETNIFMKIYWIIQNIFFWITEPLWKLACWLEDKKDD